jgi:hypothetical protein
LVPMFSSTPVATGTWPTWVVSRRRVLEAVFVLLEPSSPLRRIFIGSHSLPPLWFAVSVLQIDIPFTLQRVCTIFSIFNNVSVFSKNGNWRDDKLLLIIDYDKVFGIGEPISQTNSSSHHILQMFNICHKFSLPCNTCYVIK